MKFMIVLFALLTCRLAHADWQFGLNLGYSRNHLVTLNSQGVSGGTPFSATYLMEYESGVEFGLDAWNAPKNSWGFISGISIGPERELQSLTVNGIVATLTGTPSKFKTDFLYAGTVYRWNSFYLPLALTYAQTKFTPSSDYTGTVSVTTGAGVLLGLGWFITDDFVIEYVSRSATIDLRSMDGADFETSKGAIGSATFNFKYFF